MLKKYLKIQSLLNLSSTMLKKYFFIPKILLFFKKYFENKKYVLLIKYLRKNVVYLILPFFIVIFTILVYVLADFDSLKFFKIRDSNLDKGDVLMTLRGESDDEIVLVFDLLKDKMPLSVAIFSEMIEKNELNDKTIYNKNNYFFVKKDENLNIKIPLEFLDKYEKVNNKMIIGFRRDQSQNFSNRDIFLGSFTENLAKSYSIFAVSSQDIGILSSDSYTIVDVIFVN